MENRLALNNLRFLKRFQRPTMRIQPMKFDSLRAVEKQQIHAIVSGRQLARNRKFKLKNCVSISRLHLYLTIADKGVHLNEVLVLKEPECSQRPYAYQ